MNLKEKINFPVIVQEFLDSSSGYKSIVGGMHDFRIMVVGGEIIGCRIRIPKPGSYLANIAQGASEFSLDLDKIPEELKILTHVIDAQFNKIPRFYALDFIYANSRWYLMELNAQPGLMPDPALEHAPYYRTKLAEYLVTL